MRHYQINWGKYLVIRWLIVSWILQAVHVLDKTEKTFRIVIEFVLAVPIILYHYNDNTLIMIICIVILHTLFYFFNSTWLVGYREVDKKFRGKGIQSVVDFSNYVRRDIINTDFNAVLLYGSISRKKYHERSDLDIRIIRSSNNFIKLFLKAIKYRAIGIWKYKIPVDLKVVDSMDYLVKEMRDDEHPIVIIKKENFRIYNEGVSFDFFKKNLNNFTKK